MPSFAAGAVSLRLPRSNISYDKLTLNTVVYYLLGMLLALLSLNENTHVKKDVSLMIG